MIQKGNVIFGGAFALGNHHNFVLIFSPRFRHQQKRVCALVRRFEAANGESGTGIRIVCQPKSPVAFLKIGHRFRTPVGILAFQRSSDCFWQSSRGARIRGFRGPER
jgi:hypothetical protein